MEDIQMKQSVMHRKECQIWCQNLNDQVRLQKTIMVLQFCVRIKHKTWSFRTKGKKKLFTRGNNRFWIVIFTKYIICKIWKEFLYFHIQSSLNFDRIYRDLIWLHEWSLHTVWCSQVSIASYPLITENQWVQAKD